MNKRINKFAMFTGKDVPYTKSYEKMNATFTEGKVNWKLLQHRPVISSLSTSTFGKDWKTNIHNWVLKSSNSSSSFFHRQREIQQRRSRPWPSTGGANKSTN
jgi:hypothetical protein